MGESQRKRGGIMKRVGAGLALLALAGACGDTTGPDPTPGEVAGSYVATEFVVTTGGSSTDQLAAGSELNVTLLANGMTTGLLFVPGGAEDGGHYVADLAGSWTLAGRTVTIETSADTFLRDMAFRYENRRLRADQTFGGTRVEIVLERQ
jgi:hypothetical protein